MKNYYILREKKTALGCPNWRAIWASEEQFFSSKFYNFSSKKYFYNNNFISLKSNFGPKSATKHLSRFKTHPLFRQKVLQNFLADPRLADPPLFVSISMNKKSAPTNLGRLETPPFWA